MAEDPDETLSLLADLTGATDQHLRALSRRLAGRLMVELARNGEARRRGGGQSGRAAGREGVWGGAGGGAGARAGRGGGAGD